MIKVYILALAAAGSALALNLLTTAGCGACG